MAASPQIFQTWMPAREDFEFLVFPQGFVSASRIYPEKSDACTTNPNNVSYILLQPYDHFALVPISFAQTCEAQQNYIQVYQGLIKPYQNVLNYQHISEYDTFVAFHDKLDILGFY